MMYNNNNIEYLLLQKVHYYKYACHSDIYFRYDDGVRYVQQMLFVILCCYQRKDCIKTVVIRSGIKAIIMVCSLSTAAN